jgi:hypothetical protein
MLYSTHLPSDIGYNQGNAQIGAPVTTCNKDGSTASLFVMQTALGVHYDAGHWFHVAENFMAQHSMVRQTVVALVSANEVNTLNYVAPRDCTTIK